MKRCNLYLAFVLVALVGCTDMSIPLDPYANVAADTSGSSGGCVQTLFYQDLDDDKFGNPNVSLSQCTQPPGYVKDNTDCDDTKATTNPKADELCNKIDDNCDGITDNTTAVLWYADMDQDGHGDPKKLPIQGSCKAAQDWLANVGDDCDDTNPNIHPGATETCNGIDDNCDGQTDEGKLSTFYVDADHDGYGSLTTTQACDASLEKGIAISSDDCNDKDPNIHPGAAEVCNGVDDNCNGQTDEGKQLTFYKDVDGDGYGDPNQSVEQCSALPGTVTNSSDCDDTNPNIHPGQAEICNGVDDNCNGQTDEGAKLSFYRDADGDGFGDVSQPMQDCTQPLGFVKDSTDCDDTDKTIYPGAPELCDGKINSCTGVLNEPDSLCDDGNGYTTDVCGGVNLCSHLPDTLVFTATKQLLMADGKTPWPTDSFNGVDIFYQLGQTYTEIAQNKTQLTWNAEEICKKLQSTLGLTLNGNAFMQLSDDYPDVWIGGPYVSLSRISGDKKKPPVSINGTYGTVTKFQEVDVVYTAKDLNCL